MEVFKEQTPLNNELTGEAYLSALSEQNKRNVTGLLNFADTLDEIVPSLKVAVTAVGSTTRPEEERRHAPEGIDLRILSSFPTGSSERERVILAIQEKVKDFLSSNGTDFEFYDHTVSQEGPSSYLDWYNLDPSFVIKFPEGLPIHLSISGVNNPDVNSYLDLERANNSHFALLKPPATTGE